MSLLRPALRPALNPITKTLLSVARRFFTQFDEVANSYIMLPGFTTLSGDFEISLIIAAPFDGARMILGNSTSSSTCLFANNSTLNARDASGVNVITPSGALIENQLNHIRLVKTGGNLTIFVNGTSQASGAFGNLSLDQIGVRQNNAFNFNGIIADVKIIDNGTTVLDMPIDQNYTPTNNTVIDRASGNNGTFVNVADGDSTFYQLIGGQWVDADGNAIEVAY